MRLRMRVFYHVKFKNATPLLQLGCIDFRPWLGWTKSRPNTGYLRQIMDDGLDRSKTEILDKNVDKKKGYSGKGVVRPFLNTPR